MQHHNKKNKTPLADESSRNLCQEHACIILRSDNVPAIAHEVCVPGIVHFTGVSDMIACHVHIAMYLHIYTLQTGGISKSI